ncbi:S9 family peptidase [Bifidobacterium sp.]|jgi:oligopeptidase B|uniref:S9 family peptidase n=1 Tax=Bifidobacterium sp. TaxID=41200 RepID=UPI0025C44F37|nr:S9 family peptidase [Bifidobacterium sp.]MCH4208859.1 S9 family peptidase [Bifidobacterium sp.]MCI1225482.1 S9 family peptidase [Bifidobacterium sp.]
MPPPKAKRLDHIRTVHGDTFVDPYDWMRDKDSTEVRDYVKAQNDYCQSRTAGLKDLSAALFDELKGRVQETDMSVPTRIDGYWYFVRTQEGRQYATQCRIPISDADDWNPPQVDPKGEPGSMSGEQIVFDANLEAQGHDFFRLGGLDLSRDGRWLLYGVDTAGDERYDFRIRDLRTGTELPEVLHGIGGACFTPDAQWVFYVALDEAWRPYAIRRHHVGTPVDADVEVFREDDERFWVGVGLSFDERRIVISTSSKTSGEVWMLPVSSPEGEFRVFIPRQDDVEYDVSFACFEGAGGQGEDIPLAVVYHNALDPNFEIDVIDMRTHEPPYRLGEGVAVALGSPYGCEQGDRFEAGASAKPVSRPYNDTRNPAVLQGARGLGIEGIALHRNFVSLSYRANSLPHVAVMAKDDAAQDFLAGRPWRFREIEPPDDGGREQTGQSGEPSRLYSFGTGGNPSYDAPRMRYSFDSYTRPGELHELDPATGEDILLKRAQVLGGFDAQKYSERRVWVSVRDGEEVPVSLVWRTDMLPGLAALPGHLAAPAPEAGLSASRLGAEQAGTKACGTRKNEHTECAECDDRGADRAEAEERPAVSIPMFITGYGAYEISSDPGFSAARISLLDRGVLYAVPHIRGGGEMGRAWYEHGRRLEKKHTFEDFVDATAALQYAGFADPARTMANGGSAGGLLMGAVANMAPERYAAIEADVPFVDALTSILDPSLPLTVTEWDEWGDPLHDERVYRYMKSYTPYENAPSDEHPAPRFPKILVTTSMNDTRVLVVEPLKWIARLQSAGVDVIAKIEIEAGHGGTTGRYKQWEEVSYENAWCLDAMGATQLVAPER